MGNAFNSVIPLFSITFGHSQSTQASPMARADRRVPSPSPPWRGRAAAASSLFCGACVRLGIKRDELRVGKGGQGVETAIPLTVSPSIPLVSAHDVWCFATLARLPLLPPFSHQNSHPPPHQQLDFRTPPHPKTNRLSGLSSQKDPFMFLLQSL